MTAIIKNYFRLRNAKDFIEHFTNFGSVQTLLKSSTTTNNSTTVTCDDTSDLLIGAEVSGSNIPVSGTPFPVKIVSIDSPTQFTLNRQATGSGVSTLQITQLTRNHYVFIGKPTSWGTQSQELSPPAPIDTKSNDQRIWEEMLSLKKVDESSASLVIPRSNWDETGKTVYAIYDDSDPDLYIQPTSARSTQFTPNFAGNFYVVNDQFDIFICLNNNRNSLSTVKPLRPNPVTNLVSGADGYVWKFVGAVKSSDQPRFVTDSWIPVKTIVGTPDVGTADYPQWQVQQAAVPGQILSINIDQTGSGYVHTYTGGFTASSISNTGGVGVATLTTPRNNTSGIYEGGQIHITSGADNGSIYTIANYTSSGVITLTTPWSTTGGTIKVTSSDTCQILPALTVTTNSTTPVKIKPIVTSGNITGASVIGAGQNATYTNIVVQSTLGGSGAQIRAILSDENGLGKDIEKDLGANYVMLNARLTFNEGTGDFPINNDYRQIGIIRNVKNYDGTMASASTLIATKKLNLENVLNPPTSFDAIFQVGSNSAIQGIVLDYIPSTGGEGALTYIQNPSTGYGAFSPGQIQGTGTSSTFSATIKSNGVINEEVKKLSGEIIYIENRRAILRSQDQIEDIKTIIEF
ncbi:hypothetical protein UFOVP410_177 [uncultured Caudovirales phage]|uniref:Uncharacterized protein n=1 Tax=uncultured Caudovirales phage TaxID=2100421 RepID=A0A6J5M3X9_9CAUD|nr:hypothetical protein UFOVP410_177 [uncultured Caudovirales phage]